MDQLPSTDLVRTNSPLAITLSPKAEVMKSLADTISTNELGLPEYFYRADLIDPESTDHEHAIQYLDYSQGYAAQPNGDSIWSQLPHEPVDAFNAFVDYLQMPRSTETGKSSPIRQLNLLKPLTGKTSQQLLALSYMYYWPQRCRAYDLYVIASHTRAKELRTQGIEESHYDKAERFIQYAEAHLEKVFNDPEGHDLSPKEAFDILHKMMMMQRLSVGLSPNGAHANKDVNQMPVNASMEVIMRTLAKNAGVAGSEDKSVSNLTQEMFKDPALLEKAQEVIIRVSQAKNPREQKSGKFFDS